MPIYRLVPTAAPEDPRWQNALHQGELLVRAPSSGEARAIAALEEASIAQKTLPRSTTMVIASAFRDDKLYTVIEDVSGRFSAVGPARVLMGTFHFPPEYHGHGRD